MDFYCLDSILPQVGDAFQEPSALQELNTIGSAPPQDHVFKVDNFVALGSIQKQLQEKIFAIEGKWEQAPALELKGLLPSVPCGLDIHPYPQGTLKVPSRVQAPDPIPSVLSPHALIALENLSDMFPHRNPTRDK